MNKKVIVHKKYDERFDHLEFPPVFYSGNLEEDVNKAITYPNALSECRNKNQAFYEQVISLIDQEELFDLDGLMDKNGGEKVLYIGFGAGSNARQHSPKFISKLSFIIDNNPQSKDIYGIPVVGVDKLLGFLKDRIFIFILSDIYYCEMAVQLASLGFIENVDFIASYEHYSILSQIPKASGFINLDTPPPMDYRQPHMNSMIGNK